LIPKATLLAVAEARIKDAEALHAAGRFDGAVYLCGYAVELSLKARACTALSWAEFPETASEFKGYQSFKTHELSILLRLSGQEMVVRQNHIADWSIVVEWDPESRYEPAGAVNPIDSSEMIRATKVILAVL